MLTPDNSDDASTKPADLALYRRNGPPAVPSKRHTEGTADGSREGYRGSVRDGQVSLDSLGLRRRLLF